ncbi:MULTISPECIES: DUF3368 domain-containing protein [unclassified Erwinia]|uniref:DUF3368 domain-containing protein n=1 Tax=unclassified Erwinia TaxID=2622719 RepID=UPI000AFCF7CF|nr:MULTISPECIES: DUF3368 domain-containing protein [unclassified Erwinia]
MLDAFFTLPWQIMTPDILFYEELEAFHPTLLAKGLKLQELLPATMEFAWQLTQRVTGPGRHDCFALALAKQEKCPLLTGDRALRKAAESEKLTVMGSLWVVEQLVLLGTISPAQARTAYRRMKDAGRRLPWDEALLRLEQISTI